MNLVSIRELQLTDETAFIAMAQNSQYLHHPWVKAPLTHDEFVTFAQRHQQPTHKSFIVIHSNGDLVGIFNVSEIVRGCFQSAYLGFYASANYAGKGLMSAGLKLVLRQVFTTLGLHRIEANIQPDNQQSINLVKKNGFKKEGFSPRYLNIDNQWRDHERWAITFEDWEQNK